MHVAENKVESSVKRVLEYVRLAFERIQNSYKKQLRSVLHLVVGFHLRLSENSSFLLGKRHQ